MLARRTTSFGLIGPRSTLAPRPGGNHPIPGTRAIGPVGRVFSRAAPCPRDEGRRHELGLFGPHRREHDPPLRLDALPCGQHRHDGDPLELELRLNAQDAAHLRPVLEQLARDHTAGSRAPAARHVQVPSCRAEVSSISKRLAMPTVNLPPPQAPREYRRRNPASRLPLHSRRAKLRIVNQTPRAPRWPSRKALRGSCDNRQARDPRPASRQLASESNTDGSAGSSPRRVLDGPRWRGPGELRRRRAGRSRVAPRAGERSRRSRRADASPASRSEDPTPLRPTVATTRLVETSSRATRVGPAVRIPRTGPSEKPSGSSRRARGAGPIRRRRRRVAVSPRQARRTLCRHPKTVTARDRRPSREAEPARRSQRTWGASGDP